MEDSFEENGVPQLTNVRITDEKGFDPKPAEEFIRTFADLSDTYKNITKKVRPHHKRRK